jgi:hypothetical protein
MPSVPLVLAIEPDLRQAAIVKRIVREKVHADVAVVDTPDAALEAMRARVPDVLLISALLSPRDEDELIAHLRALAGADHLQTHTIPQLASTLVGGEGRASRGLLSAFRRKKDADAAPAGCDPDLFAEEIRSYLERAAQQKRERLDAQTDADPLDHAWRAAMRGEKAPEPAAEPAVEASTSSWASPFEWKPSSPSSLVPNPESLIAQPEPLMAPPEPHVAEPEPPAVSLMAHLRPPAGIVTAEELVSSLQAREPVLPTAPIREPEPIHVAERIPEPIHVADPIHVAEPILVAEPIHVAEPVHVAEPIQAAEPIHAAAPTSQDAGSEMPDSGLGIRGQRSRVKDRMRFGALATWARSEHPRRDAAQGSDDLRGLLTALAVPSAVVSVGYGRGCRIRRVRVPAAREPQEAEGVGAVILSKRALAEQRDRREQPRA